MYLNLPKSGEVGSITCISLVLKVGRANNNARIDSISLLDTLGKLTYTRLPACSLTNLTIALRTVSTDSIVARPLEIHTHTLQVVNGPFRN